MKLASTVSDAMATAKGSIGTREILGAAAAVGVTAILLHNNGDTGTSGSTGTK
jgi:hypothetical protein